MEGSRDTLENAIRLWHRSPAKFKLRACKDNETNKKFNSEPYVTAFRVFNDRKYNIVDVAHLAVAQHRFHTYWGQIIERKQICATIATLHSGNVVCYCCLLAFIC